MIMTTMEEISPLDLPQSLPIQKGLFRKKNTVLIYMILLLLDLNG